MDDPTNMPAASILIVDDDPENLKLVAEVLREQGYTVRLLSHGQLALRSAQANPPELILLDIRLPDMDGYAVCTALKGDARTHAVPVIFCSALGETFDKVRAFEVGGVDYISKPFDAEEVLARVATHVALRRMQLQLQQQNDQLQHEIAERKRAEQALRESEELFRAVWEGAGDAMALSDEHAVVTAANPAYHALYGFMPEEVIGQNFAIIFPPEEQETAHSLYHALFTSGQPIVSAASLVRRKDGTQRVVDAQVNFIRHAGNRVSMLSVIRDVTERQRMEDALRASEERFRLTFDLSPIGAAMEELDGRYIRVNDTLCQITGYTREELVGRLFTDITHPEDREKDLRNTELLSAGKLTEYVTEKRYIRKDSQVAWVQVSVRLMNVDPNQPAYILANMIDITARKRAEIDLQRANHELRQRIAEISTLNQITTALTQWIDLPSAFQTVGATLAVLFDEANFLTIWLRDETGTTLSRLAVVCGDQTTMGGPTVALTEDLAAARVLASGQPEILAQAAHLPLAACPPQLPADCHAGGCMLLPLLSRGQVIGLLYMRAVTPERRFTPADLVLAQTIAGNLAGAIENARLFEAEERQRQAAESLREVTTALTRSLDSAIVVRTIFEQLGRVVPYDGAAICLADGNALLLKEGVGIAEPFIGQRMPFSGIDPPVEVFLDRRPQIIDDTTACAAWIPWENQPGILSWMGAPLIIGTATIGVLTTDNLKPHAYDAQDLRTLEAFAHQAAIAIENARLFTQAQAAAAEEERKRLARELHDSVSQALFMANLNADVLPELWERDPIKGRRALGDLQQFTHSALAEMRMLLVELRPDALICTPLHELLHTLGGAVSAKHSLVVSVQLDAVPILPAEVQIALYRIAQEALNNIVKHAQARHVTLLLKNRSPAASEPGKSCDQVILRIIDDGRGFEVAQVAKGRMGLRGMRERAGSIGASLEINSQPGASTHVAVTWCGSIPVVMEQV